MLLVLSDVGESNAVLSVWYGESVGSYPLYWL